LGVPILALCQLSREAERESAEPRLAHLRESGAIEQDADVVLMLYQDKKEEKEVEKTKHKPKDSITTYLKIAKQRNGPTGIIKLAFHRTHQLFLQVSEVDDRVNLYQSLM
jgi:replicative DNA helicase